jgi:hypothetical protein
MYDRPAVSRCIGITVDGRMASTQRHPRQAIALTANRECIFAWTQGRIEAPQIETGHAVQLDAATGRIRQAWSSRAETGEQSPVTVTARNLTSSYMGGVTCGCQYIDS